MKKPFHLLIPLGMSAPQPGVASGAVGEILYCTPKGRRALLRIPTTGRAKCLPMLGEIKT